MAKHSTLIIVTMALFVVLLSFAGAEKTTTIGDRDRKMLDLPPPGRKTRVRVVNSILGGISVALHCKSKDDDLGAQYLAPNNGFQWFFRPNKFMLNTLFFCHVGWPWPGPVNDHWFDAYDEVRDKDRCGLDCYWNINPNGPCDCYYPNYCVPWNKWAIP